MRITDFPELVTATGNDLLVTVDIANDLTKKIKLENLPTSIATTVALATKQNLLVSGTNIKTLNSVSLLGSGDIVLAATPSGVAGAIQFSNGSAFASDASNLFWDDTNNRLGIGTNAPGETLDVNGQIRTRLTTGINILGAGSVGLNDAHIFLNQSQGAEISYGANGFSAVGGYNIIGGNTTIGATVFRDGNINLGARLGIKGSGSTSATTSLLVQNSAGVSSLQVKDDGTVFNLGKGAVSGNLAFGENALINNGTANGNTAIGSSVMQNNTTGIYNTGLGNGTLVLNTSGSYNTGLGAEAGTYCTTNSYNTAVGFAAIKTNTAASNTAVGAETVSGNFAGSVILGRGATANASNQFVVGSTGTNAGAIDSSAFTQDKRWKVKINGVDYYIALQTA